MAKNTIKIKRYVDNQEEFVANATITPGMLVELMSTGKVKAHATAGGNALPKMFAIEDELQGNGVDDNYSASNKVQVVICVPGEMVYALLKDGENVSIGDPLESAGTGYLQKHVVDTGSDVGSIYHNQIVGIAREALDLSSSSGAEPNRRLVVQIV